MAEKESMWVAIVLVFMVLAPANVRAAEKLPKPDRIPAVSTPAQKALIKEGIALHDAGDFDGAIVKYEQVLSEEPAAVDGIYELAFSHTGKKDCARAMAVARRGATYRSALLPQFHMLLGSCLDDMGRPDEAIGVFKTAIKSTPEFALLHYNLGLAYVRGVGSMMRGKPCSNRSTLIRITARATIFCRRFTSSLVIAFRQRLPCRAF